MHHFSPESAADISFYNNDNGQKPYFDYEGKTYENIVVLTREDAEHAYVFGNRLYITEHPLYEQDGVLYLIAGEEEERVRIYEEAGEPADMYVLPPEIMTRVSVATRETSQTQPPAYAIQSILEQEKGT